MLKYYRPLLLSSSFLVTSTLQKLRSLVKTKIWAKKSSPVPNNLKQFWRHCVQGIDMIFFFATLRDNVSANIKKKRGKRSKMLDRLDWRREPCLCLDGSWYCSWVSCVNSGIRVITCHVTVSVLWDTSFWSEDSSILIRPRYSTLSSGA